MELTFNLQILISCFLGYFIGSIPFGLIITKIILSKDIRNIGSGNIGATNVLRTGNKFAALLTLLFDILKGIVPIIFLNQFISENISVLSGLFAILGHCFPVWLKFRGGKGIATTIGVIFLLNWMSGCFLILLWLIIAFFTKISSLAAILSIIFNIFFIIYINSQHDYIIFLISIICLIRHHENIFRIINGTERKIKF